MSQARDRCAFPFRDPTLPVEARVDDLLSRMTLEEKVAQLGSYWIGDLLTGPGERAQFDKEKASKLLARGIGQITRPAGGSELGPAQVAAVVNALQRFLIEETRLGIPALIHEECLSGFMAKGATTFPQAIGMAATWDPDLIRRLSDIIRQQMRATGAHQGLAPLLDVARDPRWGRVEETFGEDPYLVAAIATAYIRGLQSGYAGTSGQNEPGRHPGSSDPAGDARRAPGLDGPSGIVATVKHFVAYPFSEGGRNCAPVHVGERELRDVFLYPFEVAIKEARAVSLMNAYHDNDGEPCAASRRLLTGILRHEWGFDGYVVSDYGAIDMLRSFHKVAIDKKEAAVKALLAGIDVELPGVDCYGAPLIEAVREGILPEAAIDEAVRRHLRYKFRLGLFENPYVDEGKVAQVFETPAQREVARQVARESIVLLKNDPVDGSKPLLPLSPDIESIAVIGPNADSTRNLLGDYSFIAHRSLGEEALPVVSIRAGIEERVSPSTRVLYARGCELTGDDTSGIPEAVAVARQAQVAVIVVGEKSGLGPTDTTGEGRDAADLGLTGRQRELIRAVWETGTPVVLVLVNGRPLALEWEAAHLPAIVEAWLPGEEGGRAVADVLFGDYNPGGKLPVSFPKSVGQVPVYYNRRPTAWGKYVLQDSQPLFPFGHGLSYTRFEYANLRIEPETVRLPAGSGEAGAGAGAGVEPAAILIECEVANVGEVAGEEVVQLYVSDPVASVTRPVQELKGFIRVRLAPGERRQVSFRLHLDQLAFHDARLRRVIEPGKYEVRVGASSQDIRLRGEFWLHGPVLERPQLGHYFSEVEVSMGK